MRKQNSFEQIDEYFKEKKPSEVYVIILLIMVVIGFVVYYFVFPVSESFFNQKMSENKNITKKLNNEKNYLAGKTVNGDMYYYVKKLKNEIKTEEKNLDFINKTNSHIDNKLHELSYLLFNNENWAKFLDSISEIAKNYNVKVLKITNQINEPNFRKVEQILNIHVDLTGKFHDIMNFINRLEESMLIVDVYSIKLDGKENIDGAIDIAVWGMKY